MLVRHVPYLAHRRSVLVGRAYLVLLLLFVLFLAASAHAGSVAIVRSPSSNPGITEMVSRLHGELLSVGFKVEVIHRMAGDAEGGSVSRAQLEELTGKGGRDAVLDIVGDAAPVAVDVWVIERSSRRLQVSRVELEPNAKNASERLAIRAIEVVRSSFLENDMTAKERPSQPVAKLASAPPPPGKEVAPTARRGTFGFGAGVVGTTSLDGVGPAILPLVRFDCALGRQLILQAELAGFGSRPTVATAAGNARIAQQYAVLGGRYRLGTRQWVVPFVAFSVGAMRTAIEGQADPPRQGHAASQWSFLTQGTAGTELSLPDRYYLTLAAHLHVAQPYVAVHIGDTVAATTGRPNLLVSLTGAWL